VRKKRCELATAARIALVNRNSTGPGLRCGRPFVEIAMRLPKELCEREGCQNHAVLYRVTIGDKTGERWCWKCYSGEHLRPPFFRRALRSTVEATVGLGCAALSLGTVWVLFDHWRWPIFPLGYLFGWGPLNPLCACLVGLWVGDRLFGEH